MLKQVKTLVSFCWRSGGIASAKAYHGGQGKSGKIRLKKSGKVREFRQDM